MGDYDWEDIKEFMSSIPDSERYDMMCICHTELGCDAYIMCGVDAHRCICQMCMCDMSAVYVTLRHSRTSQQIWRHISSHIHPTSSIYNAPLTPSGLLSLFLKRVLICILDRHSHRLLDSFEAFDIAKEMEDMGETECALSCISGVNNFVSTHIPSQSGQTLSLYMSLLLQVKKTNRAQYYATLRKLSGSDQISMSIFQEMLEKDVTAVIYILRNMSKIDLIVGSLTEKVSGIRGKLSGVMVTDDDVISGL